MVTDNRFNIEEIPLGKVIPMFTSSLWGKHNVSRYIINSSIHVSVTNST